MYAVYYRGTAIGIINQNTAKALQALDTIDSVTWEIEDDGQSFKNLVTLWKSKGKAVKWDMEVNVYGPSDIKDHVGGLLSDLKIYLQHPRSLPDHIRLENPHMIEFPNLRNDLKSLTSVQNSSLSLANMDGGISPPDLSEVLEHLGNLDNLVPTTVGECVTTQLLE